MREGDMAETLGDSIAGATVHEDTIVAAGEPRSARIKKGDVPRLVDLEGQQAADPSDRYNAANTMERMNRLEPRPSTGSGPFRDACLHRLAGISPGPAITWTRAPRWTCSP